MTANISLNQSLYIGQLECIYMYDYIKNKFNLTGPIIGR